MVQRISEKLGIEVKFDMEGDAISECDLDHRGTNTHKGYTSIVYIAILCIFTLLIGISLPKIILKYLYNNSDYNENMILPSPKVMEDK